MDTTERRAHRRAPTWVPAVVEGADGSACASVVLDLSMGGAAIQTSQWPDGGTGTLGLLVHGERHFFPFIAVGIDPVMQGVIVHAKFTQVERRCRAVLAELMTVSLSEFEASQRYLAMRPNDPLG